MDDTNTIPDIINIFTKAESLSSSEVAARAPRQQSLVTVKRQLNILAKAGYLKQTGAGRSVKYVLSKKGWLLRPFNAVEYLKNGPDDRLKNHHF